MLSGDVETFARCVSAYWSQKKLMAGDGVEPTLITRALAANRLGRRGAGWDRRGAVAIAHMHRTVFGALGGVLRVQQQVVDVPGQPSHRLLRLREPRNVFEQVVDAA